MDSTRVLPPRPDLGHLKRQADDLREAFARGDPDARQRVQSVAPLRHLAATLVGLSVTQAQLVVAREYGFKSWADLKQHVERARSEGETMHTERRTEARQETDLVISTAVQKYEPVGGNVVVESGGALVMFGPVGGKVTVRSGGSANLFGPVGGDVIVEPGGEANVHAPVGGTIPDLGGKVNVHAPVAGGGVEGAAGSIPGLDLGWLGPMLTGVLGTVGKTAGGGLKHLEALEGLGEFKMMSELESLSKLAVLEGLRGEQTPASRPVEERMGKALEEMGTLTGGYAAKVQEVAGKRVKAKAKEREGSPDAPAAAAKLHAEADTLKAEAKAILADAKAKLDEAVKLAEEAKRLRQVPA